VLIKRIILFNPKNKNSLMKSKLLLSLFVAYLFLLFIVSAQIVSHNASKIKAGVFGSDFGGGIFSFPDRLGIGINSPLAKLEIQGSGAGGLSLNVTDDLFVNDSNGRVGVGTKNSTAKLTIENLDLSQNSLTLRQQNNLFVKTIGGGSDDYGGRIEQTSDGGYVLVGSTVSYGAGNSDFFVAKLDSSGNVSWAKTIGGGNYEIGGYFEQTSDGGYVLVGGTGSYGAGNYDVFVAKLDSSGNVSWAKTIGGGSDDTIHFFQQTPDWGYVLVGVTKSYGAGNYDVFVAKLDSSGNVSWAKTIGGGSDDYGDHIEQTSDGGYVLVGSTGSYGAGNYDVFVAKLDSSGNCNACSIISTISPAVSSISPIVNTQSFSVSTISPAVSSISPIVNTQSFSVSTQCSGTSIFTSLSINSVGQIGIGTESPLSELDVRGKIRTTEICLGNSCYTSIPHTYWDRLENNIFYNAGNVGIGTANPKEKLEINGNIGFSNGSSRYIKINDVVSGYGNNLIIKSGGSLLGNSGNLYLDVGSGAIFGNIYIGEFASNVNISSVLYVNNSNKRVGIGINSPLAKLEIVGSGAGGLSLNVTDDLFVNDTSSVVQIIGELKLRMTNRGDTSCTSEQRGIIYYETAQPENEICYCNGTHWRAMKSELLCGGKS